MRKRLTAAVLGAVAVLGLLLGTVAPAGANSGDHVYLKAGDCSATGVYNNILGSIFYINTQIDYGSGSGCWVEHVLKYHNYGTNSTDTLLAAGYVKTGSPGLFTLVPGNGGDIHSKQGSVGIWAHFTLCKGEPDLGGPCADGWSSGVPDHYNW
jgi:hypothetical protein